MQLYEDIYIGMLGMPIIILPSKRQKRTHKKKRINKKWIKRYGYHWGLEKGQTYVVDNTLYMNKATYLMLKRELERTRL